MKILVISDIHGNYTALQKVIEKARKWDAVWVLGDLVDYGPEPHLVIDTIRELNPDVIVSGNHDYAVGYGVDCGCSYKTHELSVYTRKNISYRLLSKEQIKWLASLPLYKEISIEEKIFYLVHGSPNNPLYGYLDPNLNIPDIRKHLCSYKTNKPVDADYILVGHTHIPWKYNIDNKVIVNPGSVGQPRDGVPKASYMILDTEKFETKIFRVSYDKEEVLRKLKEQGISAPHYEKLKKIIYDARI